MTNDESSYLTRLLLMRQRAIVRQNKRKLVEDFLSPTPGPSTVSIFSSSQNCMPPSTCLPPAGNYNYYCLTSSASRCSTTCCQLSTGKKNHQMAFNSCDDRNRRSSPVINLKSASISSSTTHRRNKKWSSMFENRPRLAKTSSPVIVSLWLLLMLLTSFASASSNNPFQLPYHQRSILAGCLFGTKPVNINDVDNDNSNFQLEPPQNLLTDEDTFSHFTLRTRTALAKFIHIAVVANLSSNVLALHESKLNVSVTDIDGHSHVYDAVAEPVYQRYCGFSSNVVPMYSWLLSLDRRKIHDWQNSTTTWQISWMGPAIGRSYSIQLHVFTVNRDRSVVNYLYANSSVRGIGINYDCDAFAVRGKKISPWDPLRSSIQISVTPLVHSSLTDNRKTTILKIEDVSKQVGIQGFLVACAPWNWTTHSVHAQSAFGKWYLADDGSTMAHRSECAYSSYREFDRRRKFLVKMVYAPPTVHGEFDSEIVNEQITCMALVVLGNGTVHLIYPPSPITKTRPTTSASPPTSTSTFVTVIDHQVTPKKKKTTMPEIEDVESHVAGFVETNATSGALPETNASARDTQVIGFIETKSSTNDLEDSDNETITILVLDGSNSVIIENVTLTTAAPKIQQTTRSKVEDKNVTAKGDSEDEKLEMIDYDCATMTIIGSNSTPKYLINEADTLDGNGKTYEEVGPFAITFIPANITNNQELSVTLEPEHFFRGFFVKCGTRDLMRESVPVVYREQVDPQSAAMYLTGYRSEPVDRCNFTGAAAKQADLNPKVEQILFVTLPDYQRDSDIVVTCWATVVVNSSDYWIISSSMPMIRRPETTPLTTQVQTSVRTTTVEEMNVTSDEPTTMTVTQAQSTETLTTVEMLTTIEIVTTTVEETTSLPTTTEESTTMPSTTISTESSTEAITTTEPTSTSTTTIEVVDCSAMALFRNHDDNRGTSSVISSEGDEVYFNFTSTMAHLPYGFITGTLIFSDEVPPLIAAYLFGCMSATSSPGNYSTESFGIVHEVTTPELENNDNVLTLPSFCGENYRQDNSYFVKSTKKIHFAWHLPETLDATSGICRAVILLRNGSYILRQSMLIEIVHPANTEVTSAAPLTTTLSSVLEADMLYGFPASLPCSYVISTMLSPQRFRDCLECGSKVAALEFVESSVKLGGNMTVGIVSADSDFVISDFAMACYIESTGEPVGRLYEAPIQANLLPALQSTIDSVAVPCKNGVVRNRDVGPVYEVFYVWQLPEWIPFNAKQLRCSAMFPSLPNETLLIVDSLPLRRVGPNYEVPASATLKPQPDDYDDITTTSTTTTTVSTTVMKFRILPHIASENEHELGPLDADYRDPYHRFRYDCFEFSVKLPKESDKDETPAPYSLYVSSTEFLDGQNLRLVINTSDAEARPFRGFMVLCAHVFGSEATAAFKADAPAGRLVETLTDGRVLSAAGGCGSRVEVSARQLKTNVAFLWKAPVFSEFQVQCRAIVIENEHNYWTLNGPLMNLVKPTTTTQASTTLEPSVDSMLVTSLLGSTTTTTIANDSIASLEILPENNETTSKNETRPTLRPKKVIVITVESLKKHNKTLAVNRSQEIVDTSIEWLLFNTSSLEASSTNGTTLEAPTTENTVTTTAQIETTAETTATTEFPTTTVGTTEGPLLLLTTVEAALRKDEILSSGDLPAVSVIEELAKSDQVIVESPLEPPIIVETSEGGSQKNWTSHDQHLTAADNKTAVIVEEAIASENFIEVTPSSWTLHSSTPKATTEKEAEAEVEVTSAPTAPAEIAPGEIGVVVEGSGASLEKELPPPTPIESQTPVVDSNSVEIETAHAAPPNFDIEEEPVAIEIFQPSPIAAELVPSLHAGSTVAYNDSVVTSHDLVPSSIFFSRGFDCRRDGHACRHAGDPSAKCDRFTGKCICSRPSFSGYDCSVAEILPNSACHNGKGCSNGGVCGRRFGGEIGSNQCFCPYDYLGEDCEIPRVSAQCDNIEGMRIQVVPFANENLQQPAFAGSVRIVSTLNKTSEKDRGILTSALLSTNDSDCNFRPLPGNNNGVYVLDRPFNFLVEKCGARMTENNTVYVQFMIQYSAFDMLTAFDPVYLIYCDLSSPTNAPATTAEPEPAPMINVKKAKTDSKKLNHHRIFKTPSFRPGASRIQMTFTSKVSVSSSLDSLPRQIVVGMANSTRLYQAAADQVKHNMSFVIRKRSLISGTNTRTPGQSVSVEEIRLSDILEIEVSNHDTSYFKYLYLDECRVEFDQSRQPGAILVSNGCPTPTVRRYLVDWMADSEDISAGELLNSAVGVASNDSSSVSTSFSYSAFWPTDSRALFFNCSVNLCGADMADDCPQKVCPPIPGFTLRHKRRRRREVSPEDIFEKRKKAANEKRSRDWLKKKERMQNAAWKRSEDAMRPAPKTIPSLEKFIETGWSSIWLTMVVLVYIAGIYFVLVNVMKFFRWYY